MKRFIFKPIQVSHVKYGRKERMTMPNHSLRSKRYGETVRLVTIGGNFGIRFIAITQFASMVDKLVVKMAQQRYFGLTSEKNDLDYLRSFLGDRVREVETLETGQFLYDFKRQTKMIQVINALEVVNFA